MGRGQIVLLPIKPASYRDIRRRIEALGSIYIHDFIMDHPEHGKVLVFGEVGFVPEEE